MAFSYTPLDATLPTIRLVRLSRAPDSSIKAILGTFSLDARVPFRTLSYVWGNKEYTKHITLNGHSFPVLDSIYPVLQLICDSTELSSRWWWIDSICINQGRDPKAVKECGSQIRLMGRIYKESEKTLGWLGNDFERNVPGKPGSDAMDFLRVLLANRDRLDSSEQRAVVNELSDRTKWPAIEWLLSRPWWRRVWTLQEYIIAREFDFYCGGKSISRDDFKMASYSIYLCRHIDKTLITYYAWQPMWHRRRLFMLYTKKKELPLLSLMAYASASQATVSKDRIYAVLGLAKDGELTHPIDFESDVGEAYSRLVKTFVEIHQSLDILCFVHVFNQQVRAPEKGPILPSWVPDWRVEMEAFVIPVMASQSARSHIGNFRPPDRIALTDDASSYAAAGDTLPDIRHWDDPKLLSCKGIFVDYVDGVGGLKVAQRDWTGTTKEVYVKVYQLINSSSPFNSTRIPNSNPDPGKAAKLLDDISRCLVLDRKDRYLSYPTPPRYFYADFKAICLATIKAPKPTPSGFLDWFEENKSLEIRGHSLEDLCLAAESPSLVGTTKDIDMYNENVFLSRFKDTTESMARRLITTKKGQLGMGPCRAQKGDRICVLLGCSIPLVLRPREGKSSYEVIGECYLHGYMNGEVLGELDGENIKIAEFELS